MTGKYETFKACDDLSPEDFKNFTGQYWNEFGSLRTRLIDARNTAARADALAQYYTARINELKRDALRHGVELPC